MTSWITGTGAVASVGRGVDDLFTSLCAGRTGLAELRGFDRTRFRATRAYEIDDRPGGVDVPGRATRWLLEVVGEAARQAGLGDRLDEIPVLVGTGLRELRSVELWRRRGTRLTADRLHFGPALRERFGAVATYTISNACSASLYALALGADLLEQEAADTVVVAGVDVLTESMVGLLDRVHVVPPDRLRPFDRDRTGVLLGDGAAAVVLRRPAGAAPAGVRGTLRAVGVSCDASHVTAPDPPGLTAAMRQAHRLAGVKPEQVDLVLMHGTGTRLNDRAEATALATVFGEHAGAPLVTAIKSMTGHTSGASGLVGVVVAVESIRRGVVPPTVGLDHPAAESARFRFPRGAAAPWQGSVAQVNAFGFGGVNAVAIVEAVPGHDR